MVKSIPREEEVVIGVILIWHVGDEEVMNKFGVKERTELEGLERTDGSRLCKNNANCCGEYLLQKERVRTH